MAATFLDDLKSGGIEFSEDVGLLKKDASLFERKVRGVIRPKKQDDVAVIVAAANRHGVSLYPFSGGKNWGYGTALPVRSDSWLLDLSRLNRILGFDRDALSLTIEPGVTQATLQEYLKQNNIPAMIPNTGIGAHGNILGNILEKGFGVAPLQDHASSLMSVRAVLGDGSIYESFFRGLPHAIHASYRWGLGPSIENIFLQSNFAVVTEATIRLMPRPERIEIVVTSIQSDRDLTAALLCGRMLGQMLPGQFQAFKIIDTPQLQKTAGEGANSILGVKLAASRLSLAVLYSNDAQLRGLRKIVRKAYAKHGLNRARFFSGGTIAFIRKLIHTWPFSLFLKSQSRALESLASFARLAEGHHNAIGLNLLYPDAHEATLVTVNPAHDGKNIIWYVPVIPMQQNFIEEAILEIQAAAKTRGLGHLSLTISSLNDTSVAITVPFIFRPEEREAVYATYRDLLKIGSKKGFFPYRVPIEFMPDIVQYHPEYWKQIQKIKKALDPKDSISSGRYSL